MISWMSNWAQGIIVALIVGTIIEMILPNGNNKKYVKTVIGVYIVFVLISPIVKIFKNDIDFDNLLDYEQYIDSSTYQTMSNSIETSNVQNVENIYKQKIKEDLELRLKDKKYTLEDINMNINLDEDDEEYGKIISLNIKIRKNNKVEEKNISSINKIEKIDIQIGENKAIQNAQNNIQISNEEVEELKQYIYENYGVDKNNIIIN